MSLKKLRHTTEVQEKTFRTRSLKKFSLFQKNQHAKTTVTEVNPQMNGREKQSLAQYGITLEFLANLYERRCQENEMKIQEDKFKIFSKHFMSKVQRTFEVSELRFKETSMCYFLKGIMNNQHIVGLDLSNTKLSSIDPVLDLISKSQSICKLHLCNMSLQPKDMSRVFSQITQQQKIIHLDLSNRVFEGSNKLGQNYSALSKFLQNNQIIQILQLQGLYIRDKGLEAIIQGVKNQQSNLISLNLKNNGFSRNGYSYIKQIIKYTELQQLNISDNRLGNYGVSQLQILRSSHITKLNLSNTDMQSQGLSNLFKIVKDSKSLTTLILDRNNFHHNWFKRIQDPIATNKSLKSISMNSCHIKYIDSLFHALVQNHFVTKLDISNNNIQEHLDILAELVKRNNSIKQLKIRQCNITGTKAIQFINTLTRNVTLKNIDLSDNDIGIEPGKQLLKSVLINNSLINLNLEKTQIQLSAKMNIEVKLNKNKIQYQRNLRNQLKKQSIILKSRDNSKHVNIALLIQKSHNNKDTIQRMKNEIEVLNTMVTSKGESKTNIQNNIDFQMASLNKQLTKIQVHSKPKQKQIQSQNDQIKQQIKQLLEMKNRQQKIIAELEKKLQLERDGIKTLEDKLEKQLETLKYINKRNNSPNKLPLIPVVIQSPKKSIKSGSYKKIKNISKIDVLQSK